MNLKEEKSFDVIRQAVDQILNVNCVLKRKNKREFDKEREFFLQVVQQLDFVTNRSNLLFAEIKVDLSNYDELFLEIIDILLVAKYGKHGFELITYYLFERSNPDGSINPLVGPEGENIILETPLDLWNLLLKVSPNLK